MSRIPLPCPVNGCPEISIQRTSSLVKHFIDNHSKLIGSTVQLPSNTFRPSWKPFFPLRTIHPPPSLPTDVPAGSILVTSSPAVSRRGVRFHTSKMSPPASQVSSPRKQSQRQIPNRRAVANEDSDELLVPEFENLHHLPEAARYEELDLVVWQRPEMFNVDVARVPRMRELPIAEPPVSILYEVFAKRVDDLELHGLINM